MRILLKKSDSLGMPNPGLTTRWRGLSQSDVQFTNVHPCALAGFLSAPWSE